jgi:hypothetical protein
VSITKFQFEQMQQRTGRNTIGSASVSTAPLEKKIHQDIIAHCNAQWPRWKFVHSRMDKPTRNQCGVPDFVIALPGARTLYIEAKRPGEKISPAQRDWHAEMTTLGHTVHVVHTLQEFLAATETSASDPVQPPPK